jgi:DNA-binding transcriptional ArsR family regulator
MTTLADRLRELAQWEHADAELLNEAADKLDRLQPIRSGTAANWLQHRLPADPFTAQELADLSRMNIRTVQQAIVDLKAAGLVESCGIRRRKSGKGQHPRLYRKCA